jgi:hypothetical protein
MLNAQLLTQQRQPYTKDSSGLRISIEIRFALPINPLLPASAATIRKVQ